MVSLLVAMFMPFVMNAQNNSKDMWDYVTSFTTSTGRQHAVVYDGEFIYTAAWGKSSTVEYMFFKYDLIGNLLDQFDVPGVAKEDQFCRDLTFDGTYFYGCDAHSGKIWCYDLHNKTLKDDHAINTSFSELGTCTYDPDHDAFWVGERATGSSPSLMMDLKLVNRSGVVIQSATPQSLGGHTAHGTGLFYDENGGKHIYLFGVQGFTAHVFDYNVDTDYLNPNYVFDYENCPGWGAACSAGGAFIGEVEGVQYFFGDVDKSPNLIGIYSLGEYTPIPPTPPEGNILFDFNDGIMHLNTIDADGDGYNWEMRQNWGDPENPYCATSASVDIAEYPLYPENYMVTPYKLDCEQIIFKACTQDVNHPAEHIGVAISTDSDDPDDFTVVWEHTMAAKEVGNWYEFNIDLRDYQGQDIYVAILHFNCSDQFMVNVDDILLNRIYDDQSVGENSIELVSVYPNPAKDVMMVESAVVVDSYEIYNVTGAMVRRNEVGATSFSVDVRDLSAGSYFLKMNSEGLIQSKRFVVE